MHPAATETQGKAKNGTTLPDKKCSLINKYFQSILRRAKSKTNRSNKYFGGSKNKTIYFSLRKNGAKNKHITLFQNKSARDFAPAVYPITSYRILTIFAPFESRQSHLSENLNCIKLRWDLTGSIKTYNENYKLKFHFKIDFDMVIFRQKYLFFGAVKFEPVWGPRRSN